MQQCTCFVVTSGMPKSENAAYDGTYFITLSLNLTSASLLAAGVIILLHNGYNNFAGRRPLEKLYGIGPVPWANNHFSGSLPSIFLQ